MSAKVSKIVDNLISGLFPTLSVIKSLEKRGCEVVKTKCFGRDGCAEWIVYHDGNVIGCIEKYNQCGNPSYHNGALTQMIETGTYDPKLLPHRKKHEINLKAY
jgi:hypothetical protein